METAAIMETPKTDKIAVEVKDLNAYFGSLRAVKDFSLNMLEKKVTALIGPSGCGKSQELESAHNGIGHAPAQLSHRLGKLGEKIPIE